MISYILSESKIVKDKELLILFNVMLLALDTISELEKSKDKNINVLILFLLAVLAIVINSIALVAIITRVTYGFTPNKTVVLVSNVLIFVNLILMAKDLFRSFLEISKIDSAEKT